MSWAMNQPRRLPAGALMLVIVVSMVVAAILLALLLLTSNRRLLMERDESRQLGRRNLLSGLAYVQAHPELPYLRPQARDLFGAGTDSILMVKKPWGIFDMTMTTSTKGGVTDTLMALLGSQFSDVNQAALYLANENIPLSLNGDAQVRGRAYLPKAEPARDANLLLTGPPRTGAAVTSQLRASRSTLPIECDTALNRLRQYAGLQLQPLLPAGSQPSGRFQSRHTSFAGPATVLYQTEPLVLAGLTLTGQILVANARRLVVEASNHLDNVLLIAPVVIIKAGFRGRVQIIARDTVDLQPGCELVYPSAISTFSDTTATQILLGAGSRVSGVVLAAHPAGNARACLIRMGPGAVVEGQVFSAGTIENCGSVLGTVMCRRLLYRTPATFYDNYLVNAVLNRRALPAAFLTSPLLNPGAPTGIVTWLR